MLTLTFLAKTIIELYVMVLLLRIWMQWSRCDFYNPFSQFIVRITQPIIGPLRRVIPSLGPVDTAFAAGRIYSHYIEIPVVVADSGGRHFTGSGQPAGWTALITESRWQPHFLGHYCALFDELGQPGP